MSALDESNVKEGVEQDTVDAVRLMGKYKHGWESDVETEFAPMGLNEDIVRLISAKKREPEWMLEWRLAAYRRWVQMTAPDWAMLKIAPIDYQEQYYYAQPKGFDTPDQAEIRADRGAQSAMNALLLGKKRHPASPGC